LTGDRHRYAQNYALGAAALGNWLIGSLIHAPKLVHGVGRGNGTAVRAIRMINEDKRIAGAAAKKGVCASSKASFAADLASLGFGQCLSNGVDICPRRIKLQRLLELFLCMRHVVVLLVGDTQMVVVGGVLG